MNRRKLIILFGSATAAWPLAVRAQPSGGRRRVGVLMNVGDDAGTQVDVAAFLQTLQQRGWTEDRNVRIDIRFAAGDPAEIRRHAAELAAAAPDVIVVTGTAGVGPVLEATRSVPIVFANVADPVGAGYIDSMARPGGNATGFLQLEYTLSGKWPELLKQIVPQMTRVAVLRDPAITSGIGQFAVIESVAPSLGLEVSAINLRDPGEIERGITKYGRTPNGGLIVTASALSTVHRDLIIELAARHKLPMIAYRRLFPVGGGLISYGPDVTAQYRGAAGYVDRILRGEKPGDLPVQAPAKYELVINLKTSRALGVTMPAPLLATADEVIE